jgi:hypothetical protein
MRWACASIDAAASKGFDSPYEHAVPLRGAWQAFHERHDYAAFFDAYDPQVELAGPLRDQSSKVRPPGEFVPPAIGA